MQNRRRNKVTNEDYVTRNEVWRVYCDLGNNERVYLIGVDPIPGIGTFKRFGGKDIALHFLWSDARRVAKEIGKRGGYEHV
jgi:hypothetical protein